MHIHDSVRNQRITTTPVSPTIPAPATFRASDTTAGQTTRAPATRANPGRRLRPSLRDLRARSPTGLARAFAGPDR